MAEHRPGIVKYVPLTPEQEAEQKAIIDAFVRVLEFRIYSVNGMNAELSVGIAETNVADEPVVVEGSR